MSSTLIRSVGEHVLRGGTITREEASTLMTLTDPADILELGSWAARVRAKYTGTSCQLCALVNAKAGECAENCGYCSQSSHHQTDIAKYPLMDPLAILERAHQAEQFGAKRFCIVTATRGLSDRDLPTIAEAVRRVREQTSLAPECSLGFVTDEQLAALKEAGMTRYNHNLETCESNFPNICTTHTYQDRVNTLKQLKRQGMERCAGGILGLGETPEGRLDLAFALAELGVECVPVNVINPRPGTPLEQAAPPAPLEVIKTVAIFRLILPWAVIELAGGREANVRDLQSLALLCGANGLIIGSYLTTIGRQPAEDLQLVQDLGFTPDPGEARPAAMMPLAK
ncbi:MAG: biotin synthase BioB [Candidatus Omnitrophica bacterium]|nr:biotin synthase BioB [Candidatus Omnitrophota bacterium]